MKLGKSTGLALEEPTGIFIILKKAFWVYLSAGWQVKMIIMRIKPENRLQKMQGTNKTSTQNSKFCGRTLLENK